MGSYFARINFLRRRSSTYASACLLFLRLIIQRQVTTNGALEYVCWIRRERKDVLASAMGMDLRDDRGIRVFLRRDFLVETADPVYC